MSAPVITIDGPSSSGKGTIAQLLAERLGWHLLDSGAVYRVLALIAIRRQLKLDDISLLVAEANNLSAKFVDQTKQQQKVFLGSEDITAAIRSEECGIVASKVAVIAEVRAALIPYLQSFNQPPGLIADGRDMGTVVFTEAYCKIFLTASVEERARRRLLQLQGMGINATLSEVLDGLVARDVRDQNRIVAPLKPDPAAMIIDTTKLKVDEVLQLILAHVKLQ